MHFLQSIKLDSDSRLSKHFMPHQVAWIQAEKRIHEQHKQAVALAEKSVRIGWTYADAFKNVRKRLWFKGRDYLFATKDFPSALEYVRQCYKFAEIFNLTRSIISHGEENLSLNRLDENGRPSAFTDNVKIGVIKFDNGSRIIAFSSNPQAMSVYGGDVGLDEFAKHPNARLLWETAQARVTWNYDLAVWSSHDGEDTLFNEFAHEARAACSADFSRSADFQSAVSQTSSLLATPCTETAASPSSSTNPPIHLSTNPLTHPSTTTSVDETRIAAIYQSPPSLSPLPAGEGKGEGNSPNHLSQSPLSSGTSATNQSLQIQNQKSKIKIPSSPWNIYFHVTLPDAIRLGLVDRINAARGTRISPDQFLADCRARARDEETFQQAYMCNPLGAAANRIVEWSAVERCRANYQIERTHLEAGQVRRQFGDFNPSAQHDRESQIHRFLRSSFPALLATSALASRSNAPRSDAPRSDAPRSNVPTGPLRLGFDVAASGQGDLAAIYIDEAKGDELWLRALLTCRTEDWHFLKTVLFFFLKHLPNLQAAGDESGLGRQICWEAAEHFSSRFLKVNFAAKKHDLGFALMNQLSVAKKRFPGSEQDIAADYFALRKTHNGARWAFTESQNHLNLASHCDIAWAGALATHAHTERRPEVWAAVLHENGWSDGKNFHPYASPKTTLTPEQAMLLSDDPRIWRRVMTF